MRGVCCVELLTTPAVAVQLTPPDSNPRLSNNSAPGTGVGVGVGLVLALELVLSWTGAQQREEQAIG